MRPLKKGVIALPCLAVAGLIGCSTELSMNPSSEGERTVAAVSSTATLPGTGQDIAVLGKFLYMVSNSGLGWQGEAYGYDIYQWLYGKWQIANFQGKGPQGKGCRIDVDADGYPYVLDMNKKLFRGFQGSWIKMTGPGTGGIANDFGSGSMNRNYVWATNERDELFRGTVSYNGSGGDLVTGISWTKWSGASSITRAKHLDVDYNGGVWFYDMDRNVLAYALPTNQPGSKILAAPISETGEYLDVATENNKNPFVLLGVNGFAKIYRWDSYAWTWTYENMSFPYSSSKPIRMCVKANGISNDGSLGYDLFITSSQGNYKLQATTNSYSEASRGVVAYYPFTNSANDVTSTPVNGKLVGVFSTTFDQTSNGGQVGGYPNCAYVFNGTSNYIDLGDPADLQFTNGSMSIAAYIKIAGPAIANSQIVFRGDNRPGMDPYMLYLTANNEVAFSICNASGVGYTLKGAVPSYCYGRWVLVVATLDGPSGKVCLYLIGGPAVAAGTTAVRPFGPLTGTKGVRIGSYISSSGAPGQYFNGAIDNVAFFNRAVSEAEVNEMYLAGEGMNR